VPANDPVPAAGEPVRVYVPADRLHLFDPATGTRLEAADARADHQR
jgi:multiple sugar transport system ATP-binding protein